MRFLAVSGLALLAFAACPASAATLPSSQAASPAPAPPFKRQLSGVTDKQADELIAKIKEAQRQLKNGDKLYFELLSGAPASYDMTNVAPRAAFLAADFDRTWRVEHKDSGNPLWQPYKLSVVPGELGQLYWEIEVVIGFYGNIERVKMYYQPPYPF